MSKRRKVYLLTYEELERFDHLLTALGQAYWALVTQRSVNVPAIKPVDPMKAKPSEEKFYQLHLDLNNKIDSTDF